MNKAKFFRFTIEGDELDPTLINSLVDLPAEIYFKGDKSVKEYINKHIIVQKTNRWVYYSKANDNLDINLFLLNNLKNIISNFKALKPFINQYTSKIELVVYAEDETDLVLTKETINLLNQVGVNFHISFC